MIQIKDIISYLRFNNIDLNEVKFGYYDRVAKQIFYREFLDIEKFESSMFISFTEDGKRDLIIPHTRVSEFYINNTLIWWRHPETDIHDYGCKLK